MKYLKRHGMAKDEVEDTLPDWVKYRGGRKRWARWVQSKINNCRKKAKKLKPDGPWPTVPEIRAAILDAIEECKGTGVYSKIPLYIRGPSGISVGDPKMLWLGGMKAGGRSDEPKRGPFSRPPGDFSS